MGDRAPSRRRPKLGQNFLIDSTVSERIVDWAGVDGRDVLEVGPGRGALTELLIERAGRLALVELDSKLAAHWREEARNRPSVSVLEGDAARLEPEEMVPSLLGESSAAPLGSDRRRGIRVIANLPYESGTAILTRLMPHAELFDSLVVMLQREVAMRFVAAPGSRKYGRLSVFTAMYADAEGGIVVPPEAFRPAPKVFSQVLKLSLLDRPRWDVGNPVLFRQVVDAAFATRRKMLRNGLGKWLLSRWGEELSREGFEHAGILSTARPEEVAPEQYAALSCFIERHRSSESERVADGADAGTQQSAPQPGDAAEPPVAGDSATEDNEIRDHESGDR